MAGLTEDYKVYKVTGCDNVANFNDSLGGEGTVDLYEQKAFNDNKDNAQVGPLARFCGVIGMIVCCPVELLCCLIGCKDAARDGCDKSIQVVFNEVDYDRFSPEPSFAQGLKKLGQGNVVINAGNGINLPQSASLGEEVDLVMQLTTSLTNSKPDGLFALKDKQGIIRMVGPYDIIMDAQKDLDRIAEGGDKDSMDAKRKNKLANFYTNIGFADLAPGPSEEEAQNASMARNFAGLIRQLEDNDNQDRRQPLVPNAQVMGR